MFSKKSKCVPGRTEILSGKKDFQNSIAEVNTLAIGLESGTNESNSDVAEESIISFKECTTPSLKKGKESSNQRHNQKTSPRSREGSKITSPSSAGGVGRRKLSSQTIMTRTNMSEGKRKGLGSDQIVEDTNVLSQRGEDFIIMSGPIGIKNSGWQ